MIHGLTYASGMMHITTKAIRQTAVFTVSLVVKGHMDAADYYGIAKGNKISYISIITCFVHCGPGMIRNTVNTKWEEAHADFCSGEILRLQ